MACAILYLSTSIRSEEPPIQARSFLETRVRPPHVRRAAPPSTWQCAYVRCSSRRCSESLGLWRLTSGRGSGGPVREHPEVERALNSEDEMMSGRESQEWTARRQFSVTPAAGLLQRRCACGGTPGLDEECAECRNKRLTLQRRSTNQAKPSKVPP